MCGIAAIYAYHYAATTVNQDELRSMRDHMAARGPDGEGEWYSANDRVGLAHRRLAIIDLSDRAAQPMSTADGQLVITFNGEIYNYKELRQDLEAKGIIFRSQSDTEVILHLYAQKGAAMLHDLRGMFAFALWNAREKTLLLARDPYGIKPLYYADDGWTVRVASQVKALLASEKISRQPEPAGIVGFFDKKPGKPLPDNIAANELALAQWRTTVAQIESANRQRTTGERIVLETGRPSVRR